MTDCLSCATGPLEVLLSLGKTPLANRLLEAGQIDDPEPRYPLDFALCSHCALVQITTVVPPDEMFSDYPYFSSFSDTMVAHAAALVRSVLDAHPLDASSLAIEVASNDGYLLKHYQSAGIPVLGIEPAKNVANAAVEKYGIPTRTDFFGKDLADRLAQEGVMADVIHANNVLAHVPDLRGFVQGLATVLKPDGIVVIEVPYLLDLLDHCEFDTIYHEHLCYFSLTSLDALFRRNGLTIQDVQRIPIHGGSLRLFIGHEGRPASPSVEVLLDEEHQRDIASPDAYSDFVGRVQTLRDTLTQTLRRLKDEGHHIAAYGASAKGSTLLNYFGIGKETLDFVADRSTHKQGRFTPGTHIPIVAPSELVNRRPAYTLLLTWNFAEEIMAQQQTYREKGGRFIIPIPNVQVV